MIAAHIRQVLPFTVKLFVHALFSIMLLLFTFSSENIRNRLKLLELSEGSKGQESNPHNKINDNPSKIIEISLKRLNPTSRETIGILSSVFTVPCPLQSDLLKTFCQTMKKGLLLKERQIILIASFHKFKIHFPIPQVLQ